jgi:hypothetical protein
VTEFVCRECGCINDVAEKPAPRRPRSHQQLKRLMAVCEAALHQWPSSAEFRPKNKDHLRYFLEVECGHFDVEKTIHVRDGATMEAIAGTMHAVMQSNKDYQQFITVDGSLIVVKRAKSISYDKLGHQEACKLFQDMDDVLHAYGLNADQLLQERGKAA